MEKEMELSDKLKEEIKNGELFIDWFGNDPYRIVTGTGQVYQMKFLRVKDGMVRIKLRIGFSLKEGGAKEIADILSIVMPKMNESTRRLVLETLPEKVRDLLGSE